MKIRKPDDEKFFKDIVLNDILVEISNEHEKTNSHQPKSVQKKYSSLKIVTIIISVLIPLILITLWYTPSKSIIPRKQTPKEDIDNSQSWKMDKDIAGYKQVINKKTISQKAVFKEAVSKEAVSNKPIKEKVLVKPVSVKPIPMKKTERELAKEALRQQMLH